MKLLNIRDASVDTATGLVETLMGDNAKLLKALAEMEEEAAGSGQRGCIHRISGKRGNKRQRLAA